MFKFAWQRDPAFDGLISVSLFMFEINRLPAKWSDEAIDALLWPALDSEGQSVLTKIPQFSSGEWRSDVVGLFPYCPSRWLLEDRLNRRSALFFENFVPPFPEKEVTNGNTSRGGARKGFLTDHYSLPKHFRAATAGSLNSQHTLSQLSPSDLRKTAHALHR
jgi:hypothetical protein